MRSIVALAIKDLRLLRRVRIAFFFTFFWPVIVAVMFGYAFGGPDDGAESPIAVALVDEDDTEGSRAFAARLAASGRFTVEPLGRSDAETAVRRGRLSAFLVISPGFGAKSDRLFYGEPREILVGADPSRKAEAGMLEGLLMQAAAVDMQEMLSDPQRSVRMADQVLSDVQHSPGSPPELGRFFTELKTFVSSPLIQAPSGQGGGSGWQPLKVTPVPVTRVRRGPVNAFAITFPQGVLWALIGCAMSFGISLVSERTRGTFVRLQMAPLSRAHILAGKAAACLVAMTSVQVLLFTIGALAFGVRPASWPMLALASTSAMIAFTGLMMLVATLGTTEQAASGTGWAIMMPLSMVGGGMVPQFVMPAWMQSLGVISPVMWGIRAIEGALWREFTLAEMAVPCAILVTVGLACFVVGTRRLR